MERRGGDWIVGGGADDEEDYDGDEYDDEVEEGAETKEKEGQQQQDKDEAVEDDDDEQGGLLQLDDEDDENQNVNVNSMASNSNGGNANVDVDADAAGRTKTSTAGQQRRGDAAAAGSSSSPPGSTRPTSHRHTTGHGRAGISTATATRTAAKGGNNNNNNNGGSARRRPLLPPPLTTTRRLCSPDALPMPPSSDGRDDINNSSSNTDDGSSRAAGGSSSGHSDRRRLLNSGGAGAGTRTRTDADADADGHTNHSAAALHAGQGQGQGPTPEMQIQVHVGPHEEDPTFDWAGLFGPSRFAHQPVPSVSVELHASTYATELVRARNEGWPIVVQDARGWAHFCCRWLVRCDDSKDACDAVAGANQHQQEEKREQQQQQQQRRTYFMDQPDPAKAAMTFPLCRYVEEGWSIDLDRMRMDLGHSLVPLSIFEPSGSSSTGAATGGSSEPSHVYREVQRVSLWTALPLIFKDYFSADDEGTADLQGCPPGCRYAINDYKFSDCKNASAKLSAQCSTCLEGAFGFDILSLSLGAELLPGRTLLGGELLGDNPFQYLSLGPKGTRVETKDTVCGLIRTDGNLDATFCVLSGSVEFVVTHRSSMAILTEMKPSITSKGIEAERCCRPGASKIQSYRTVLGPGDIIFIPTGCLYSIQYLSNCVMYQRLQCTASNVSDYARSLMGGNGPKGCEDERCAYFHNMAEGMCNAVNHETEHAQSYVQMGDAGRHVVAGLKQHVDRELKDVALGLISIRYMLWVLVQKMKAEEPVGLFEPYTMETWEKLLDTVDRCLHAFEFRFCVTVPPFRSRGCQT